MPTGLSLDWAQTYVSCRVHKADTSLSLIMYPGAWKGDLFSGVANIMQHCMFKDLAVVHLKLTDQFCVVVNEHHAVYLASLMRQRTIAIVAAILVVHERTSCTALRLRGCLGHSGIGGYKELP